MGASNTKEIEVSESFIVKPELQDVLAVHMIPYLDQPWHLRTSCRAMMRLWDQNRYLGGKVACPILEMTFRAPGGGGSKGDEDVGDDDDIKPPSLTTQREGKEARPLHRRRLLQFYQHYAPSELNEPNSKEKLEKTIKSASKGEKGQSFEKLWLELEQKYGPESKVPGYGGRTTLIPFDQFGEDKKLLVSRSIPVSLALTQKESGGLSYGLKKTLPNCPPFQLCHLHFENIPGLTSIGGRLSGLPVDRISSFPFLKKVTVKQLPDLTTINDEFLAHCDRLEEIIIEDLPLLKSAGNDWLRGCAGLQKLVIRNLPQLVSVGNYWIDYCPKMSSLTLEGLTELRSVGSNWLCSCRNLRGNLTISGEHFPSLSSVGEKWLVDSIGLDELELKDLKLLKSIKGDWLAESGIEKLRLIGLRNFHPDHHFGSGLLRSAYKRSILRVEIQASTCSEYVVKAFKDNRHDDKIDIIE